MHKNNDNALEGMDAAKEDVSLSAFEERNSIQALIDKLSSTDPINAEECLHLDDDDCTDDFRRRNKKRVSIKACKGVDNIKLEFSETFVFCSIKRKIDLCSFQSKKQL